MFIREQVLYAKDAAYLQHQYVLDVKPGVGSMIHVVGLSVFKSPKVDKKAQTCRTKSLGNPSHAKKNDKTRDKKSRRDTCLASFRTTGTPFWMKHMAIPPPILSNSFWSRSSSPWPEKYKLTCIKRFNMWILFIYINIIYTYSHVCVYYIYIYIHSGQFKSHIQREKLAFFQLYLFSHSDKWI